MEGLHLLLLVGLRLLLRGLLLLLLLGGLILRRGVLTALTAAGGHCAVRGNELRVYVDGRPVAGDPRAVELRNHQQITVAYGTDFAGLPSRYQRPSGRTMPPFVATRTASRSPLQPASALAMRRSLWPMSSWSRQ